MSREYAEGLWSHKQAVFKDFQQLIPKLDRTFPKNSIVIRPHPTERQDVYNDIAARCSRVHVTNEGNVVPWILASKAVLHNGCTTGIEAFVMGVPAISCRLSINEDYDNEFYRLPNAVSHQCFNFDQLQVMLHQILAGKLGAADGDERQALVDHYLAPQSGPLACERMVDVLEAFAANQINHSRPSLVDRLRLRLAAARFHLHRRRKLISPGSQKQPEFQRHRYPGITMDSLTTKITRIQKILKDTTPLDVKQLNDVLFQINV
jgi:hypothetical protein